MDGPTYDDEYKIIVWLFLQNNFNSGEVLYNCKCKRFPK